MQNCCGTTEEVYNCVMKIYPNGNRAYMVNVSGSWRDRPNGKRSKNGTAEPNTEGARRRARSKVKDLCLSNEFRYFVTLTLDPSKINRYDPEVVTAKLNTWLDNHVRRDGLAYVLVAEHHKDGAIHFHGFFNDSLKATDSHLKRKGRKVYNLPQWTWGFTTAIKLYGSYERAVNYVLKYLSKEGAKIGGRWYYSGGDLKRPEIIHLQVDPYDFMDKEGAALFDTDFGRMVYWYGTEAEDHGSRPQPQLEAGDPNL